MKVSNWYKVLFNFLSGTMAEVKLECILFFSLLFAYLVCYHGLPNYCEIQKSYNSFKNIFSTFYTPKNNINPRWNGLILMVFFILKHCYTIHLFYSFFSMKIFGKKSKQLKQVDTTSLSHNLTDKSVISELSPLQTSKFSTTSFFMTSLLWQVHVCMHNNFLWQVFRWQV